MVGKPVRLYGSHRKVPTTTVNPTVAAGAPRSRWPTSASPHPPQPDTAACPGQLTPPPSSRAVRGDGDPRALPGVYEGKRLDDGAKELCCLDTNHSHYVTIDTGRQAFGEEVLPRTPGAAG